MILRASPKLQWAGDRTLRRSAFGRVSSSKEVKGPLFVGLKVKVSRLEYDEVIDVSREC